MNRKRKRSKMKPQSKYFVLKGSAQLSGAITNTSAGGAFVITRYEIDTTLCLSWQQAGQLFARWRIKRLTFGFRAIKGTTTDGNVGIVFLPDTNMATPTTTANALSNERAAFGHIYQNIKLVVKPKHESWLFTRDAVASTDDRLEMPGDVCIFTENCSAAFAPGIFYMQYEVEFDDIANSTVLPFIPQPKQLATSNNNNCPGDKDETSPTRLQFTEEIDPETLALARRIHAMKVTGIKPTETKGPNNKENDKPK